VVTTRNPSLAHRQATADAWRGPHLDRALALMRGTRAISDGRLLDASSCIERMRQSGEVPGALGCQLLLVEAKGKREPLEQLLKQIDVSQLDRSAPQQATGAYAWAAVLACWRCCAVSPTPPSSTPRLRSASTKDSPAGAGSPAAKSCRPTPAHGSTRLFRCARSVGRWLR
jgi:hypothetical protein